MSSSEHDSEMIRICVNGNWLDFDQVPSGADVLQRLGLSEMPLVAELNGEALPKLNFNNRLLTDGDQLELVTVVGGG